MHTETPHVIIVSYFFPPDGLIGGARPWRFQKYLKRAGYTCDVITASAPGPDPDADRHFVPDILRATWESPEKQTLTFRGHVERLLRRLVFPGELGILWSLDVARHAREIIAHQPDRPVVVLTSFPPIGAFLAGVLLARNHRVRWIADFRDPMSIDPAMRFLPRRTRAAIRLLEAFAFRKADAVIANVEGAAAIWRQRYPQASRRLHTIWNGYDPDDMRPLPPAPTRARKVWLHTGTLYEGRNPDLIVRTLARLRAQGNEAAATVDIHLVGEVLRTAELSPAIYRQPTAEGWVRFQPRVPKPEADRMTGNADALMLLQPQSEIQVPGKMFEYVCSGRPVLGLAPRDSPVATILARSGAPSVCLHPDDSPAIADAKILEFLAMTGSVGQASDWFKAGFSAEVQARQLSDIIAAIL